VCRRVLARAPALQYGMGRDGHGTADGCVCSFMSCVPCPCPVSPAVLVVCVVVLFVCCVCVCFVFCVCLWPRLFHRGPWQWGRWLAAPSDTIYIYKYNIHAIHIYNIYIYSGFRVNR